MVADVDLIARIAERLERIPLVRQYEILWDLDPSEMYVRADGLVQAREESDTMHVIEVINRLFEGFEAVTIRKKGADESAPLTGWALMVVRA